jgi:hypothetical protein
MSKSLRTDSSIPSKVKLEESLITCVFCTTLSFDNDVTLNQHMSTMHPKHLMRCQRCGSCFASRLEVKKHWLRHHREESRRELFDKVPNPAWVVVDGQWVPTLSFAPLSPANVSADSGYIDTTPPTQQNVCVCARICLLTFIRRHRRTRASNVRHEHTHLPRSYLCTCVPLTHPTIL